MQGHPVLLIAKARVGPIVQQKLHQVPGAFHAGVDQGGIAGLVPLVHIYAAPFQESLHHGFLVVLAGLQQHIV